MTTTVFYENPEYADGTPEHWLEDSFEDCFKQMDVSDDDWDMFNEGKLSIQDLIDRHG